LIGVGCHNCGIIRVDSVMVSLSGFVGIEVGGRCAVMLSLVVIRRGGAFTCLLCWIVAIKIIWVTRIYIGWYVGLVCIARSGWFPVW